MAFLCFNCGHNLELLSATTTSRRDDCPACSADLHVCKNCKFYDPNAYNECHEPQAERVLVKDKSNYCDYFEFSDKNRAVDNTNKKEDYLKNLDDLFK